MEFFDLKAYLDGLVKDRGLFDFNKDAHYISLMFTPESKEFKSLLSEIWSIIKLRKLNLNKQDKKMEHALGVLCADLLIAQGHNDEGWAFRSQRRDSFTGEPIGVRPFQGALKALETLGYVEQTDYRNNPVIGFWDKKARRIRLTSAFLALAEAHGVKGGDLSHFRLIDHTPAPPFPIELKAASTHKEIANSRRKGDKIPGKEIRVKRSHPRVKQHVAEINEINEFLAVHKLTYAGDPVQASCCEGFRRIFSCGDTSDHEYQKGGRLYANGVLYQGYAGRQPDKPEQRERKNLLIDGEAVAEIDISGCHARILMAGMGQPIGEDVDPYAFEGIPREVVKILFSKTMGYDKFHTGWTKKDNEFYNLKLKMPGKLGKYRFKAVQDEVLARFPVLADWPTCPIRWPDLQYIEAQIIVETLLRLAREYLIPAYPVHDSIIVPASKAEEAKRVLREAFNNAVGVYPAVKVKGV